MTVRIATWNMQAQFPIRPMSHKWEYLSDRIQPDVAVLTEAKPETTPDFSLIYRQGGIGKGRRFGTIVATRSPLDARELLEVRVWFQRRELYRTWPGSVVVCDLSRHGQRLVTVVGIYATTVDRSGESVGHGRYTASSIAEDLKPLFRSRRNKGIVVAGDLNAWPDDVGRILRNTPLVDLVEHTRSSRSATPDCVCQSPKPCHHIWTHNNSLAGKFQQIDYLMATPDVASRLESIVGGPETFPDIWEWSDHAPLVGAFDL